MKFLLVLLLSINTGLLIEAKTKQYTTKDLRSPDISESVIGTSAPLRDSYKHDTGNVITQVFSLGTTRQPREILLIWEKSGDRFLLAGKRESLTGETFDQPVFFKVQDHRFLNISTEPNGSGGFVADTILWLAPDQTVHEVEFEQASKIYESQAKSDEVVLTGGEKEFFVEEDQMSFQFWIAQQGDPHCCPSGGVVEGTYKLEGNSKFDSFTRQYSADFKIRIDHLQHHPNTVERLASNP